MLKGLFLLHWACDRGHVDIVRLLLDYKANVNQTVDSLVYVDVWHVMMSVIFL